MDEFTLTFVFNMCNGGTIQKLHRICKQYRKIIDESLYARIKTKYGWNEKTCERICEYNDMLCLQYMHKKKEPITKNCCNISVVYGSFECLKYLIMKCGGYSDITTEIVRNAIGQPKILRECLNYWNSGSYDDEIFMLNDIISYGDLGTFECYIDVMKDELRDSYDVYNKIINGNNLEFLECLLRHNIPISQKDYFDALKNGRLACVKLIDKLKPTLFPDEFVMDPVCVEYMCEMIRKHAKRDLTFANPL
jgi:hypothetical protein